MSEAIEGALARDLEEALIGVYERNREMFDADALSAIDTLIALWEPGEEKADPEALSYWAYAAYEALRAVCESYAGRDTPFDVEEMAPYADEDDVSREILSLARVMAVLGQLRESIAYWLERGGLREYYGSIRE